MLVVIQQIYHQSIQYSCNTAKCHRPSANSKYNKTELNMSVSEERIPMAEIMTIDTGNIINWANMKRKVPSSSTDEIRVSLDTTLNACQREADLDRLRDLRLVECCHPQTIPVHETREEQKITVKAFVFNLDLQVFTEAIEKSLKQLSVTMIDTVLLTMPDEPDNETLTVEHIKPFWEILEGYVSQGTIGSLGVCDMDLPVFVELFDWAKVKPIINQLNLATCCVIPPEMKEFAKHNNVQLLTHADPRNVLPSEVFQGIVADHFSSLDATSPP
ncbi:glutamate--cysteine ligase regulatory subunit-like [Anneissia japonica]|uniref:glutamate--cysteine ligase regulatory subunit-like n=1 Tax=Anneissia japonica TaxID=1529436 RepID=UPI0014258051|nr:glutamate--cysteine ligase regulatory subunit-like [Anneissia japonica]